MPDVFVKHVERMKKNAAFISKPRNLLWIFCLQSLVSHRTDIRSLVNAHKQPSVPLLENVKKTALTISNISFVCYLKSAVYIIFSPEEATFLSLLSGVTALYLHPL